MSKKRKKINVIFIILIIMLLVGICVLGYIISNNNKELDPKNNTPKVKDEDGVKILDQTKDNEESVEQESTETTDNNQDEEAVEVPKDETTQNKVESGPKSYDVASIDLIGEEQVTINKGDKYVDKGARAVDTAGNDISSQIKVDNTVNTSKTGEYTITYSIGNYMVIRTVIVK